MGAFAVHAADYTAHGLAAFPVDAQAKRPLVRGWQRAGIRATKQWAERFPDADGLGIVMGEQSRLVEVDVDQAGSAALAAAVERFGETSIIVGTASGKHKLWYRHNGEGRRIRPIAGLAVDILGRGFSIAPPSYRADLGTSYRFISGGLDDLDRLPAIRANALEAPQTYLGRPPSDVLPGERNRAVWRFCMAQARHCDDLEALVDCAETFAAAMPVPLSLAEVERAARSAWRYEVQGRNFVGQRCPQVTAKDKAMDDLQDDPPAYWLLDLFRRYHSARGVFAISPAAMAAAGNPRWSKARIARARDALIERGYVEVVRPPDGRRRSAGLYRLCRTRSKTDQNHLTPTPPPLLEDLG